MEKPNIPTLPVRQVTRKRIFAIRLTDRERAEIEALAKQLRLPDSYMARSMDNFQPYFHSQFILLRFASSIFTVVTQPPASVHSR